VNLWRSRRDLADEVDQFYEAAVADWMAQGISEHEARRRARMEFGSTLVVREQVRESGWEHAIETAWADLVYAFRRLRRDRAFTFIAMVTLALGIGATTAIFSVVYPVLFAPLPYPQPNRIVMVWDTATGDAPLDVTFGTYREILSRTRAFESLAVMRSWQPTMTGTGLPERLEGQRVSAAYFNVLGVAPLIGRTFADVDDRPKGPRTAVLSHRLWQRRFSGDSNIIGRQVVLDDNSYTVAAVMPANFENVLAPTADVWSLLQYDPALPPTGREWGHHLRLVARLAPGATSDRAAQELAEVARQPIAEFARPVWASLSGGLTIRVLQDDVTRGVRPALLAILGAVALLLAIASVNVTNLLLGRATARRAELAMRSALGAGRGRLVRQLLTESVVLAAGGGLLGVALAILGVRALVALSPAALPRLTAIAVDGTVLTAALLLTTLVGLAIGLLPALHASRDLHSNIQRMSQRVTGGHQVTRRMLVVAEVALALMLLVGAGLLVRSVQRLFAVPPGFDPSDMLVMQIQTSGRRFADRAVVNTFFAQVLDAVRAVPGVATVGFTSQLPLSGDFERYGVRSEFGGYQGTADQSAFRYAVSGDYFSAMRIPVRHGRLLSAHDLADGPRVVVVSESLARRQFGDQDPLGQRIHVGDTAQPAYTVVGVAGDVKQASLAADEFAAAYVPASQWYFSDLALWLVVKTRGDAAALAPELRAAIWAVDKDQPIVRVATLNHIVEDSEADRRFAMLLFEAFAGVALVLAAIGIYGVLFAGVSERTREIGVRAALGASRSTIVRYVVREGMTMTTVGVIVGTGLALVASRVMLTMLFEVSPIDPPTYATVIVVLLAVSALASAVPAMRAAWIDPALTLRSE
jgi:putative ABC transport system permease protein